LSQGGDDRWFLHQTLARQTPLQIPSLIMNLQDWHSSPLCTAGVCWRIISLSSMIESLRWLRVFNHIRDSNLISHEPMIALSRGFSFQSYSSIFI
jgi:hypothetical protein